MSKGFGFHMATDKGKTEKKAGREAQSIIRLAGRDINGMLPIRRALSQVKGLGGNISYALAYAIENKLGIPESTKLSDLSEEQFAKVEDVIKDPLKYGIPSFLLNRRKDFETGKDTHTIGNDAVFNVRQDVNREISLRTWKGLRHQWGQKVRGQHSRSTGRTGATVGVNKKSSMLQKPQAKDKK